MNNPKVPRYVGPKPTDRLMTRAEVKARFDAETAHVYSQQNPAHLPEYGFALNLLIDALGGAWSESPRILDLGAGTGNLSRRVLDRIPKSHVVLVDFSENMLNGAREVLSAYGGRYDIQCADILDLNFPDGSFDAVVSSFALHHCRGEAEYLSLYSRVRNWLVPGGVFACCDLVKGANATWTDINEQGWRSYLRDYFDEATIEQIFQNCRSEDTPLTLGEHMACLTKAGFSCTDCLWKRHTFAVYCAQR